MLLNGVLGTIDFETAKVRRSFKQHLQHEAVRVASRSLPPFLPSYAPMAPAPGRPVSALWSMLQIFVKHVKHDSVNDSTELVADQPSCAADLDNDRGFFFEGYREALAGTVHVVAGSRRFFGFLRQDKLVEAHLEAGLEPGAPEQILVFSLGRRDWIARAAT